MVSRWRTFVKRHCVKAQPRGFDVETEARALGTRQRSVRRHVSEIRYQLVKVGLAKHRLIEPGHLLLRPRAHGLRIADQAAQTRRGEVLNWIHGLPEIGADVSGAPALQAMAGQ